MASESILVLLLVVMVTSVSGVKVKIFYKPENDMTCYTCPRSSNNTECNTWAPDVFCPFEHTVCKTVHRMNKITRETIFVEKTCALPQQCSLDTLGCTDTDDAQETECISCCNQSYCNKAVPISVTSSLIQSDSVILNTAISNVPHKIGLVVMAIFISLT